ncbi:hypothetical protein OND84_004281 [Morganella morganii]|uniref:hypothetical protein n=1 Tax=Providencia huaxiensis TaxID=2027290 RepID=UPI002ADE9C08|nr:hypothetical protein [Morganella morganii]EMB6212806.1 hypothetical protein [Morganella morganii]
MTWAEFLKGKNKNISGAFKVTAARTVSTINGFRLIIKLNDKYEISEEIIGRLDTPASIAKCRCVLCHWFRGRQIEAEELKGKFIDVTLLKKESCYSIFQSNSLDIIKEFSTKLECFKQGSFWVAYDLFGVLKMVGRPVENDGSIKINSSVGDLRAIQVNSGTLVFHKQSNLSHLTFWNIQLIFDEFFRGCDLRSPEDWRSEDFTPTHYSINQSRNAIVTNYQKSVVKQKDSTSDDYESIISKTVIGIGDILPVEYASFLKSLNLEAE